jgi:hypothetical protein
MKRHLRYFDKSLCGNGSNMTTEESRVTCRLCREKAHLGPWQSYRNRKDTPS